MGQILLTGKETQHRPPLAGDLVADRAAQHWIAGLERVEDRARRDGAHDVERYLGADVRQRPQMWRQDDSDHGSV